MIKGEPSREPRRFYKQASVLEDAAGFGVALDARALKTPSGAPFRAPTRTLAEACAGEWAAQGEHILPASMPLTRLANVALDRTPGARAAIIEEFAKYGETDLLCHRAERPEALIARQAATWDPILDIARARLGAAPPVVAGIVAAEVPDEVFGALRAAASALDDFRLTGLAHGTGLAGSALVALALADGALDAEAAFAAAALDDLWSLEAWGEEAEARARLDRLKGEFEALARYFAALTA